VLIIVPDVLTKFFEPLSSNIGIKHFSMYKIIKEDMTSLNQQSNTLSQSQPQDQAKNNAMSLQSLESCKAATKKYLHVMEQNENIRKINEERQISAKQAKVLWDADRKQILDKHYRWLTQSDEYAKWKDKDTIFTFDSPCYDRPGPGICTSDLDVENENCANLAKDKGYPYASDYIDTGERNGCDTTWTGCVRGQMRKCTRPESSVKRINDEWKHDEPQRDITIPEPTYGATGIYDDLPYLPAEGTIQCCANIINISSGNAKDVAQSCSQQIEQIVQQIKNDELKWTEAESSAEYHPPLDNTSPKPKPNPNPVPEPQPVPVPQPIPEPQPLDAYLLDNTWIIILIIVFIVIFLVLMVSSGYLMFRKTT
jgi:hypothetical protein